MPTVNGVFSNRPIQIDAGLLVLRVGVGLSMVLFHGWGKISAGPETWERIGHNMENLGVAFAPAMWGFLAAFAEFGCSILLALGVFTRLAAFLLAFTMLVAAIHHVSLPADQAAAGWRGASHALELLAIYVTLLLTGAGRYALPALWQRRAANGDYA